MREEYLNYLVAAILVLLTAAVAGYQIIIEQLQEIIWLAHIQVIPDKTTN